MAEIRCGEAVETIELRVPDSVVERFERARVLASRKAGRHLTRDETFEAVVDRSVVDRSVDSFDPLLVKEGKRRVGPTEDDYESRYIPISVKREIRRRAGDCCEFPGCWERAFLEFAHRRPHRNGSGREARHLFLLCRHHHFFQECGWLVPLGRTADPIWIEGSERIYTRNCPGGREPENERELRAAAALARRMRDEKSHTAQDVEDDEELAVG